jgi:HSP20 family molecular chaperone IbpA
MPRNKDRTDERSWSNRDDARSKDVPVKSRGSDIPSTRDPEHALARGRDYGWPFGLRLSDGMSRLFGALGLGRDFPAFEQRWMPQIDVLRRGDDLVVRADLPGMKKDDISVDVTDNVLTIRGERRQEKKEEREGYYWHERSAGSFFRSIPLPDSADADRAQARFEDGVLEISVPAPDEGTRRGRNIEIR